MVSSKALLVSLVLGFVSVNCRPEAGTNRNAEILRVRRAQTSQIDSANLPMEARIAEEVEGSVKKLPYYGGALGRFLLVEPSGKTRIVGERRVPPGIRYEEEGMEEEMEAEGGPNNSDDTVAINHPPANASIAEAKPIAVSVAGVGGMAAAKPIATAIVGPGGLALTRPVATAIAGVKGAENHIGIIGAAGGKSSPQADSYFKTLSQNDPYLWKATSQADSYFRKASPQADSFIGKTSQVNSYLYTVLPRVQTPLLYYPLSVY